jgi:hypothetical protein
MRGRRPKPTGNPGNRPLNDDERNIPDCLPDSAPSHGRNGADWSALMQLAEQIARVMPRRRG